MLPRDTLPLSQVARAGALLPVGDPRQQAFQRSLAALLGQTLQAEVLRRLDDGSYVVRVGDSAARMPLPQGAQVGQQLPLTLVSLDPRPTFQLANGKDMVYAEAGPAFAHLEGKDAAPLARSGALAAQIAAAAPLPGAAAGEGASASISPAGKLLGDVIAAAAKADAQDGAAAVARTPLLAAPSGDAGQLASALQHGLERSGLFYESHLAEWARGARTLGDLALEPQARLPDPARPAPLDPNTAQLINQQLGVQEQGRAAWQGPLWPGQELHWEVERKDDDQSGGAGQQDAASAGPAWQSRLRLRFAGLGEVNAQVVLSGQQLHIRLDTLAPDACARMQAQQARLAAALEAAGTPLATLAIHGARASHPQADPDPGSA
jgi:hypothetical protein